MWGDGEICFNKTSLNTATKPLREGFSWCLTKQFEGDRPKEGRVSGHTTHAPGTAQKSRVK